MTARFAGFEHDEIAGVPLLFAEDRRFKTLRVLLMVRRPLADEALVAARLLLPSLLVHGTSRDPDRPAIARHMDELYGAMVIPSVVKSGETQVFRAAIDAVAGAFLPGRPPQLRGCFEFLGDLCAAPRLTAGAFPAVVFERERRQALDMVRTRIDDRGSYARDEALRRACAGEPMAIPEYGSESALAALRPADPEAARVDFFGRGEIFAVACGAFDPGELREALTGFLRRLPPRQPEALAPPVRIAPRAARRVVERVDLQQSKLCLIARFPPSDDPSLWIGRRLLMGMLGGGPQSRLFQEVREKRSLAYQVGASAERHKGLIVVQAGCDEDKAEAIVEETAAQLGQLGRGAFEERELDTARAQLLHALDTVSDATSTRCAFVAENWMLGQDRTPEQLREAYRLADRDLVVRAAQGIWLDLVYLLAPRAPGGGE